MKVFGVLLLLAAAAAGIVAFSMDTTVTTGGGRVYNIGLIDARQNLLIASGVVAIVGALFFTRSSSVVDAPAKAKSEHLARLIRAVAAGNAPLVESLLTDDIDVGEENQFGTSAIKAATVNQRAEILALLEAHRLRQASRQR